MQFTQEQQYQGTFITSAKNDINIRELMIAVDAVAKKENESKVVGVAIERMAEVVASVDKDAPLHASLSELEKTIAALDPSQREKIGIQAGVLLSNLQTLQNTGAIIPAIELFKRNCEAVVIVSGDKSAPSFLLKNVLKAIAIVAIVALVTVVAAVVGFGIGFALGVCTGPGAFICSILSGAASLEVAIVSTSAGLGIGVGVLSANSLFKAPLSPEKAKAIASVGDVASSALEMACSAPGFK